MNRNRLLIGVFIAVVPAFLTAHSCTRIPAGFVH